MAKYTAGKCRQCRREAQKLFLKAEKSFTSKCPIEARLIPPGQHCLRRTRLSDYAVQLREKQKTRRIYGVLEKQFSLYFKRADQGKGSTGENLLRQLETRLDNVAFRMGFAGSRSEARQLIKHNGLLVNGSRVSIPSYQVKAADVLSVAPGSKEQLRIKTALDAGEVRGFPEWVDVDAKKMEGVVRNLPDRADLPADINESLIVELYSK